MAKTDERGRGRREWAPLPHSEFQASAFAAVGDDMPKEPTVVDETQPGPGDNVPGKRNQTRSRSSKGGEK